jgi:hypothetical protein
MTATLSRRSALQRIVGEGVNGVVIPAGFEKNGRPLTWERPSETGEVVHLVALLSGRGSYVVQWGAVVPEAIGVLWGPEGDTSDVGYSVISGTPGSIQHPPACQSFRLESSNGPEQIQDIVRSIAVDMAVIVERLQLLQTRRDIRIHLMANRDRTDRRDFVIPAKLPLKLLTAAILASIDADPEACSLAADAEVELSRYRDELTQERLIRLRTALSGLCE